MPLKVLLTGSTGMVGRHVLDQLVAGAEVSQVVCIGRLEVGLNDT